MSAHTLEYFPDSSDVKQKPKDKRSDTELEYKFMHRHCKLNLANPIVLGGFAITKHIGDGAYCQVYEATTDTVTGGVSTSQQLPEYAIKIYRAGRPRAFNDELQVLKRFDNCTVDSTADFRQYVAALKSVFAHVNIDEQLNGKISSTLHYCLAITHYPACLYDLLDHHDGLLDISIAKKVFGQICRGVAFIHSAGVVHGDLKTDNIMLTIMPSDITSFDAPIIGIVDFNHSVVVDTCTDWTACGTQEYTAPERLLEAELPYDYSTDIWSLGCIFYELITGCDLFTLDDDSDSEETDTTESGSSDSNNGDTDTMAIDDSESDTESSYDGFDFDITYAHLLGIYQLLGKPPQRLIDNGKMFYSKRGYLKFNSETRPVNLREVLHVVHEFPQNIADSVTEFLLRMIKYEPTERDTAMKLLESRFLKQDANGAYRSKQQVKLSLRSK